MRQIIIFTLFVLLTTVLFAQDGWDNWKPYSSESYYDVQKKSSEKVESAEYDVFKPKFYVTRMQNRFLSVDRFAHKYPSMSPYQYAANNPVLFIDVNGDSVDLSAAQKYDHANGTSYTNTLVGDLAAKTGLSLSVNSKGQLVYAKDKNGNAIVAKDKNGNLVGSADARGIITGMVSNKTTAHVFITPGRGSRGNSANQIGLDPNQIGSFVGGASGGLDNTTMGWAMTFMHEGFHTPIGGGLSDGGSNKSVFGHTGAVVNRMNSVRSQLGNGFGQRLSYPSMPTGGSLYIPFDNSAFNSLNRGLVPATKYIKY